MGRTYYFALYAVGADDAVLGDFGHGCEMHVDVWFLDGFHIWIAQSDAVAADAACGVEAWGSRCLAGGKEGGVGET